MKRYIKASSSSMTWEQVVAGLQDDIENGKNSFLDISRAGNIIEDIFIEVSNEFDIQPQWSRTYDEIHFVNYKTGWRAERDAETFVDMLVKDAIESESESEFRTKVRECYNRFDYSDTP